MPNVLPPSRNIEEDTGILGKVRKFVSIKRQIDDLTKEQSTLKTYLSDLVENDGEPDEKGHIFYELPEEVDGYVSLQRQRRVSQSLDAEEAEKRLKAKDLYSRCYQMLPVLDEDAVMSCLYEGLLTEEDIDAMFPKKESWAFIPVKR